ncbi:hypothetical protein [Chryseobacterium geocarposphaerae]|uniref:Uncharacterized protein n=1 Tax=Chryseobacterium geocarposphaerae TaxID=1416776 RepID=A0A2M9C8D2_9FLAO|nr:hypothetical protein [Chryseobacterium geocarposphaerae]PJJ67032.1 hypothetical protein CLV73_1028 [Chryseobacterium geocarposphaerae]
MNNNMLNKLKSDYEELEIKPSSDLWERLEGKLEEKPQIALKSSFQWWKYAAVIVVLISLGSLFYFNLEGPSQIDEVKITQNTSEAILEPQEKHNEELVLNENQIQKPISSEIKRIHSQSYFPSENISEKEKFQSLAVKEEENIVVEVPSVLTEKPENNSEKPLIADRKKVSYISAEDLLIGRELDKTREENYNDQRKFGVIDMSKIKIKGPNSLKILGFTVISDSLKSK